METTSRLPCASKRGVDVRIAWAEPVAESATHQRPRRQRRCPLHARNGHRRRIQLSTPGRSAAARSHRTGRRRSTSIPTRCRSDRARRTRSRLPGCAPTGSGSHRTKSKLPGTCVPMRLSPRIPALATLGRSERGAMVFGLGRQSQSPPAREGMGFGPRHVDGPVHGQRHAFEHAAPEPAIAITLPEGWMRDAGRFDPRPVLGPPPLRSVDSRRLGQTP